MAYETEAEWKAAQPDLTKITNPMEQRVALESWQTARPGYVNPMDYKTYEDYAGAANIQLGKDKGNDLTGRSNFYGMTIENYQNALSGDPTRPMGGNQAVYGAQLLSPLEQRAAETARGQGISTMSPETVALAKANPDVFNAASQRFQNYMATTYPGTLEYESVLSGPMQFSDTGVKYPEIKDTVSMYILDPRTKQYVKNPNYRGVKKAAEGGLMSMANQMASKGRGPDSMLIHMSPREVQGLQALAENHGGSLTINPETGLPEAGFLDKLLPTIIGFGISYISGGTIDPKTAAMIVGGVETARTGDIGKGISAGLGAYGGAGIGAGMTAAGTEAIGSQAAGQSYLSSYAPPGVLEGAGVGLSADMAYNLGQAGIDTAGAQAASVAQQAAAERIAAASPFEKLTAGAEKVAANPMSFANKDNFKYLAAAAGPILAGQAVTAKGPQTTTKPGMIRPYSFDPYGGTYTAGTPYEATPAKPAARGGLMGLAAGGMAGYEDDEEGMATGGMGGMFNFAQQSEPVVRMASGGIASYAAGGVSDADILGWFNANPGANDSLIAQTMQQAGVTPDQVARATGADYANVNERYLAATTPAPVAANTGGGDYFAQQFAPDVFAPAAAPTQTASAPAGGVSDADILGWFNANPGANDQLIAQTMQQANVTPDQVARATGANYANVNQRYLDAITPTTQVGAGATGAGAGAGTTGGLNALAATTPFTNQYTFANINDYIANNNLDAAGITAAAKQFNVDPAQITAAQNAQSIVSNVFRNVLGRDPDPNGLDYWTNQIMTGKSTGQEMLDTFIKNAQANKEIIVNPNIKLDDAVKEFGGYKSSNARDIADEWVRNTLGREVTEADRKQQWYKDAVNDAVMNTYDKAKGIYGDFRTYAQGEATATTAKAINDARASLAARGLTEADVIKQTGKTIAELIAGGTNLGLDLYQASQLKAPGAASKFDFSKIAKVVPPDVPPVVTSPITYNTAGTNAPGGLESILGLPPGVSGAGITTVNPNGTITTRPNIPGIPAGGFKGMTDLRKAYTDGGGSLGYVPYAPKTIDEFNTKYNKLTGGSKQSYDYLMGKTLYDPTPSTKTGEIMKPYFESVGRFPENRKSKKYVYVDGKYQLNPDYVKPSYVLAGEKAAADKAAGLTNKDAKPTTNPGAGNDWVWNSTDSKWEAKPISADTTVTGQNDGGGGGEANGGLMAMAGGGMSGQFDLGGYSDGGRLLRGPGDGVSDSIPATIGNKRPARLADGEFVVPARIVSELGNGSTEAGARKLYAMMDRVQKARRGTVGKGKVAKNSRSEKYLPA